MDTLRNMLISISATLPEALEKLNNAGLDVILFVMDEHDRLVGSLTDGDVRRGLLNGLSMGDKIDGFVNKSPRYILKSNYEITEITALRDEGIKVVPVVDDDKKVIKFINFRSIASYLPVDAVIMAGGRGSRLKPMTDSIPKPLLKIGNKPIIEHNIDRLKKFGVDDFWISVRYLGEQIEEYFSNGANKQINIEYIWEDQPLGTIGAVSKVDNFAHDYILVTNSDLLTTLDYESFFLDFLDSKADMAVVTIPYSVQVPYAVMETSNNHVLSFKEKPTYTYYSNGGIYLIKKELLDIIPSNSFFNSTDLMEEVIERKLKLVSFPLRGYWLDIGKPEDFIKAQEDISHLKLD